MEMLWYSGYKCNYGDEFILKIFFTLNNPSFIKWFLILQMVMKTGTTALIGQIEHFQSFPCNLVVAM